MLTASLLRRSPSLLPSARSVTKTCSTELNVLKATPSSCRIVLLPSSLYHAATSSIDWVLVCHQTQAEAWKPERKERGQRSGHAWSSCPCQTHNTSTPLDASTEAMVRATQDNFIRLHSLRCLRPSWLQREGNPLRRCLDGLVRCWYLTRGLEEDYEDLTGSAEMSPMRGCRRGYTYHERGCFRCGGTDHWQRDCPFRGKGGNVRQEREQWGYGCGGFPGQYHNYSDWQSGGYGGDEWQSRGYGRDDWQQWGKGQKVEGLSTMHPKGLRLRPSWSLTGLPTLQLLGRVCRS